MKFLYEELISIDVDVNTAEEAIRYNSDLLIKNGFVKDGYAEMVIEREKTYPTGLISTGKGIAIPHTNPDLVIKPAVCVLIPNKPLDFCLMGTEDEWLKAEVLLPLVVMNPREQMDMLKKLMTLMKKPELIEAIHLSKNKKEIMKLLSFIEN